MRLIATFAALFACWPQWSCSGHATVPTLPQGMWNLRICLFEGITTRQPCAYLDNRLILRVANPESLGRRGTVVFEEHISQDSAQKIFASALSAVRSFNSTPGRLLTDGILFTIEVSASGNVAQVRFANTAVSEMGSEVRELERLLRETARGAF